MNREARILQAMTTATPDEQRRLVAELTKIRQASARRVQASRDIELGDHIASAHLTPAPTYVRHTTDTDWLGKVGSNSKTASVVHTAAKAEASRWFSQTSAIAREHPGELRIQASGYATVWAGQFGDDAVAARDSFLQFASHLAGVKIAMESEDDENNPDNEYDEDYSETDDDDEYDDEGENNDDYKHVGSRRIARSLSEIAEEIESDWGKVNFGAKPYLDAMFSLNSITDSYYQDSAKSIVAYFLSNASSWKGDKAKAIKAELKAMMSGKSASRRRTAASEPTIGDAVRYDGSMWYVSNDSMEHDQIAIVPADDSGMPIDPQMGTGRWVDLRDVEVVIPRDSHPMWKSSRKVVAARPLYEIAEDIQSDWRNVNFGAVPYLEAMHSLESISDRYYEDPGSQIVAYFLSNASSWKGDKAKEIKAELKAMLKTGSRRTASCACGDEMCPGCGEEMASPTNPTMASRRRTASYDAVMSWCDRNGYVMKDFPSDLIERAANSGDMSLLEDWLDSNEPLTNAAERINESYEIDRANGDPYGAAHSGLDRWRQGSRRTASNCSVCGDAIASHGDGYHHDNGEKHDHEAKPGKESSRRTAASAHWPSPYGEELFAAADAAYEHNDQQWFDALSVEDLETLWKAVSGENFVSGIQTYAWDDEVSDALYSKGYDFSRTSSRRTAEAEGVDSPSQQSQNGYAESTLPDVGIDAADNTNMGWITEGDPNADNDQNGTSAPITASMGVYEAAFMGVKATKKVAYSESDFLKEATSLTQEQAQYNRFAVGIWSEDQYEAYMRAWSHGKIGGEAESWSSGPPSSPEVQRLYLAIMNKIGVTASRKHAEAEGVDSPSQQSQNGYAESGLDQIEVGDALENANLGWIDTDPEGANEMASADELGPFDARRKTAADVQRFDDGHSEWKCNRCSRTVERWPGEGDVSCDCGAEYNAAGQQLRDDWRGNMSNYDDDISDMDGFEYQHANDDY